MKLTKRNNVIDIKTAEQTIKSKQIAPAMVIKETMYSYKPIPDAIFLDSRLKSLDKIVLAVLYARSSKNENGETSCKLTRENIMAEAGIKKDAFYEVIKRIKSLGYENGYFIKEPKRDRNSTNNEFEATKYFLRPVTRCNVEFIAAKGSLNYNSIQKALEGRVAAGETVFVDYTGKKNEATFKVEGSDNEDKIFLNTPDTKQVKVEKSSKSDDVNDIYNSDLAIAVKYFRSLSETLGIKQSNTFEDDMKILKQAQEKYNISNAELIVQLDYMLTCSKEIGDGDFIEHPATNMINSKYFYKLRHKVEGYRGISHAEDIFDGKESAKDFIQACIDSDIDLTKVDENKLKYYKAYMGAKGFDPNDIGEYIMYKYKLEVEYPIARNTVLSSFSEEDRNKINEWFTTYLDIEKRNAQSKKQEKKRSKFKVNKEAIQAQTVSVEKREEKQEQEPPLNEEQKALLSNHTMTGGVYAIPRKNSSGHYPVKDKYIALQALNYIDNGILPDLKNQTVIKALTEAGYFSTEEAKQ